MARSEGGSVAGSQVADDVRVASRIGTGLAQLIRLIERAAVARGEDLDRASFMLLHTLVCLGPSRVTMLAAAVHSDPSTVSRQAAHLVDLGLLERRADPGDGRASLLAITDAGTALLERARQRRDDRIEAITRSWQPVEREQFADLIDRFTAGYERNWCADRPAHS
ncbi:MAG TPA: MarR family transcriptional regulator [Pseudonocardiaceae bacterium]|nr:MarR family transcriptional regulator [Pseudonocardiaceae bacterium]